MAKAKSLPALSDSFRKAWEACAALWPIFIARLVFLILNFGALIFCLFLSCWPLVTGLAGAWKESGGQDFPQYLESMNWMSYFPGLQTILMVIGLGLLFITWWSLLAALFDGAVYSSMRKYQEDGDPFSLSGFFKDGVRYLLPMIGLQASWFMIFMGFLLVGMILSFVLILIGQLLFIPWWVGVLFCFPAGVVFLLAMAGLISWAIMGGAYLMEGKGVFHALKAAFEKTKANYGRVLWAFLLLWIIYMVFYLAFQTVMSIFGAIPFIGAVFVLAQFMVNLFLSVVIWIYMPALAVAFSLEEGS